MQLKITLSILVLFAAVSCAFAQDRIYTKSGGIFEVKIKEIGTRNIIYKKWNNQEGPDYVMAKNEVERIKYQNGDEEILDRHHMPRTVREKALRGNSVDYGKNIFSLSPVFMTNVSPVGFGLSYERILDKSSIISFYFPIAYSFKNNGDYYNYNTGYYEPEKNNMIWFYPGAKIYPTGSNGIVRYSVGPMLAFGTGNRQYTRSVWDPASQAYTIEKFDENITVMGFLVNNSLNIQPSPKVHLGLELGLGIPYYTNEKRNGTNHYPYNTFYDEPLVQFNFNVGYRF